MLERARVLRIEADILAAMSLEALQGSAVPFDERIHAIRPHHGQQAVAANIRDLLREMYWAKAHEAARVTVPIAGCGDPSLVGHARDFAGRGITHSDMQRTR